MSFLGMTPGRNAADKKLAYVSADNVAVNDTCKLLIQQEYACKAPIIQRSLDPLIFFQHISVYVWGKLVCVTTQ